MPTTLDRLPATTEMGSLHLRVADLASLLDFYTRGVGLRPINEVDGTVTLGLGDRVVVVLEASPELRPAARGQAGLFHTAVLFDSAADLSASLVRMFTHFGHTFTGSADHLVSEAFYFTDPEGNGVELYVDRPRDAWTWVDNRVSMDTIHLDPRGYLERHLDPDADVLADDPSLAGTLGHVHLQVGDIPTARRFYVDVLGFDETFAWGTQALFVSAGGYHHHMAMNTWQSRGAGKRAWTLGMGDVVITLPASTDLDAVGARLRDAGHSTDHDGRTLTTDDPWNNRLRLTSA